MDNETLLTLTADIVAAHVANNSVATGDIAGLVERVYGSLSGLGQPSVEVPAQKVPVVSARASVKPDYIVCMECGKKQKMLKRHLMTAHGMSPEQYRQDYGLPASYPMVAETYSERRRVLAKQIGLGRKPGQRPKAVAATPKEQAKAAPPAAKKQAKAAAPAAKKQTKAAPSAAKKRAKAPAKTGKNGGAKPANVASNAAKEEAG
jgi:predicted transcriptional regulator